VVDVDTVNLFKSSLDEFWMHPDVNYAYVHTAELIATGTAWKLETDQIIKIKAY